MFEANALCNQAVELLAVLGVRRHSIEHCHCTRVLFEARLIARRYLRARGVQVHRLAGRELAHTLVQLLNQVVVARSGTRAPPGALQDAKKDGVRLSKNLRELHAPLFIK